MIKTSAAEWLIEHDSFVLLQDSVPWWLLTHFPEANDVFTWLDGIGVLAYIGATALILGGWITLWLRLAGALPALAALWSLWLGGCMLFALPGNPLPPDEPGAAAGAVREHCPLDRRCPARDPASPYPQLSQGQSGLWQGRGGCSGRSALRGVSYHVSQRKTATCGRKPF